jgi:hypothetical protein
MHKKTFQNHPLPKTLAANQYQDIFQGRVLLTPTEAGAACGWAKQTVYNKISKNNFPIPLVDFNGRKMVRSVDFLEYVEKLRTPAPSVVTEPCKVGRPTKAESIRRKSEKKGVAA